MKIKSSLLLTAIWAASTLVTGAQTNLQNDPAYLPIDKLLDPQVVTPKVSVNLPRFLLMDAVSGLDMGPDDPFAAAGTSLKELVGDIKLIRLLVIETDEKTKPAVDKAVAALRKQLDSKWLPIVSIPDENVGVYVLGDEAGEQLAGLAVLVYNDGDAVIGNIVGNISLGKILRVASKMNGHGGDLIPKDLMRKLAELAGGESSSTKRVEESKGSEEKEKKETPKE